jgi:hypothetical protein
MVDVIVKDEMWVSILDLIGLAHRYGYNKNFIIKLIQDEFRRQERWENK